MKALCQAVRKDGQPCGAVAQGDGYCFAHSPALHEVRQRGSAAGGRNKSAAARVEKLLPATLKGLVGTLVTALDEVHAGTLEPRQASAMASLAGAIGRLYEVGVLEQRLEALEEHQTHAG